MDQDGTVTVYDDGWFGKHQQQQQLQWNIIYGCGGRPESGRPSNRTNLWELSRIE